MVILLAEGYDESVETLTISILSQVFVSFFYYEVSLCKVLHLEYAICGWPEVRGVKCSPWPEVRGVKCSPCFFVICGVLHKGL